MERGASTQEKDGHELLYVLFSFEIVPYLPSSHWL